MLTRIVKCTIVLAIPAFLMAQPALDSLRQSNSRALHLRYAASTDEFGLDVFKRLAGKESAQNVFVSPASIFFCLAMVNEGSAGTTLDSIRKTLQLQNFSDEEIREANLEVMRLLSAPDTSVDISIANSLWMNAHFSIQPDYVDQCRRFYLAETFVRDFRRPGTLDELNGWVSDKTNKRIGGILDHLDASEVVVLVNAIYFHGKWSIPFDSTKTSDKPFFVTTGTEKTYPRMWQRGSFAYDENSDYQAVRIPYGPRFSMCIFLPRDRTGLRKMLLGFDNSSWSKRRSRLHQLPGVIELPRFKLEYSTLLAQVLGSMGMGIAFTGGADFSRMTQNPAYISDVVHKTFLEVNEKGTTAAAATATRMGLGQALQMPSHPFSMIINHPFLCIIDEDATGLILFVGAINDPTPGE